jgi:ferredoxin-NADP reductase
MPERKLLTARLRRSTPLSDRTKHLEFEVEELPRFDFAAGQFVSMKAQNNGREITRAYSIASPPRGDATFDVCLNRVEGGFFSNYLCDIEPGAEVKFHGPHGYFVTKSPLRDSVFIATGTGIAPIRGMLHWLFADPSRHEGRKLWLVFGTRYEHDIYYRDEFERMAGEQSNFSYLPTLSRAGEEWKGLRGYVQTHATQIIGDRTDMDAYICGLRDMVEANRALLKQLGWDRKQIIYERFD